MAKVVKGDRFVPKAPTGKKGPLSCREGLPRMKVVFRILDSWGSRVIEEYSYNEKEKATKKLEEYHRKGLLAYYLQQAKVPL